MNKPRCHRRPVVDLCSFTVYRLPRGREMRLGDFVAIVRRMTPGALLRVFAEAEAARLTFKDLVRQRFYELSRKGDS